MFSGVGRSSRPYTGLAVLMIVAVLVSACAGGAAPTSAPAPAAAAPTTAPAAAPTEAPTTAAAAPTTEVAPTTAAAEASPAATTAAAATAEIAPATTAAAGTPEAMATSAPAGGTPAAGAAFTVPQPTVPAGKKYTIALMIGVKNDGFYVTMGHGAQDEAAKIGNVDVVIDGPAQFSAVQQTPIIDAMIARKVDAMMVAATDKQAMIEPLKRVNDAGIPVISVDTFIGNGDYANGPVTFPLSYIGSDNVQGGMIGCDALIKASPDPTKAKIYIQNVNPGISTTDQREEGCKNAIKAAGATLVGVDYNNDSAATSAQQTAAVLQRTPDLTGIFGANLFSAEGAAQAVKNAGLTGVVKVANFDAPESAIQDLRNKVVDIVIAQKPADIGRIAVDYAVMALNGDKAQIQKRVPTGYVVITRDNVDSPEAQGAIYKSQ